MIGSVVVKNSGHCFPLDLIIEDFKNGGKIPDEIEAFSMGEGYHLF